jgi:1-deoxy-D-xylulose-5-phosphate synthase
VSLLERINSPADLRRLSIAELGTLAEEIRALIIATTARTGGHTAPSLGVVELTLALHYAFDTPQDQIVWDVGHQCYAHKIVTGRRDRFSTLRQESGIAGFPKRAESEYDVFDTGHSGNSIGVAVGLAVGDRLSHRDRKSIAVIGDGSIVAGMAFEALNHGGSLKQDLVVVLNDNEMSIARSTGAMSRYLSRIITGQTYNQLKADVWNLLGHLPRDLSGASRAAARKIEEGLKNLVSSSILFEELGFRYVGPVNGHSLAELIETFQRVRRLHGPILVHVATTKGKGYAPAVRHPELFHGTGPFQPETGTPASSGGTSFTATLGRRLLELAGSDDRVCAITAGMCLGTGLTEFRDKFPNRFFDVGICEQHALTFAAGLAQAGMRPVVAVYSTFLARAVDQLIQDVCLQNLPVVLAVDRAGLVGEDGPTHHGVFDLTYLTMVPNLAVLAPMDETELSLMLDFALPHRDGPVAIRYPRGGSGLPARPHAPQIQLGRGELLRPGSAGCVVGIGVAAGWAMAAADRLAGSGVDIEVLNARFAKPLDRELLLAAARRHSRIVTIEENVLAGGFGDSVGRLLEEAGVSPRLLRIGLPDRFVEQAPRDRLLAAQGLSVDALTERLLAFFTR